MGPDFMARYYGKLDEAQAKAVRARERVIEGP